jgi:hypothetical protein
VISRRRRREDEIRRHRILSKWLGLSNDRSDTRKSGEGEEGRASLTAFKGVRGDFRTEGEDFDVDLPHFPERTSLGDGAGTLLKVKAFRFPFIPRMRTFWTASIVRFWGLIPCKT